MNAKTLNMLAMLLLVIGGLNWGLVGLLNMNLVTALFGSMDVLPTLIYALIGASAVYIGATQLTKMG